MTREAAAALALRHRWLAVHVTCGSSAVRMRASLLWSCGHCHVDEIPSAEIVTIGEAEGIVRTWAVEALLEGGTMRNTCQHGYQFCIPCNHGINAGLPTVERDLSVPRAWTVAELENELRARGMTLLSAIHEQAVRVVATPWKAGENKPVHAFGATLDEAVSRVFAKLDAGEE